MKKEFLIYGIGSLIAFIVSVVSGIMIGNSLLTIIVRSIFSVILYLVILFISLSVLKKKVPEVYELVATGEVSMFSIPIFSRRKEEEGEEEPMEEEEISEEYEESFEDLRGEEKVADTGEYFGNDYILVEDKMIKNDPKLMAQAIRTILSQDEG